MTGVTQRLIKETIADFDDAGIKNAR